jgi:hypothetical protein
MSQLRQKGRENWTMRKGLRGPTKAKNIRRIDSGKNGQPTILEYLVR